MRRRAPLLLAALGGQQRAQRVAKAGMSELQDWAMRLLDARSLDEVFAPT